jgi:nucleotide-binding universal stress UspA family protein
MSSQHLENYRDILLPLDNSPYSAIAEDAAVLLAQGMKTKIIGLHVYSGHFHRVRFNALEEFLPEKYQKEELLEYQRNIHSVLIERGLEIISLEYMKRIRESCHQHQIAFEERLIDGKNADVIIDHASSCDLIIMGAQGFGAVPGFSNLGSTTHRVLQHIEKDLLVMKKKNGFQNIFVCIDGSNSSMQALQRAIFFAQKFHSQLTILSSFDPKLHPVVFKSLVSVLSDEAGRVFKFKDQEQLHTSVIDTSLEDLYKGYLAKGKQLAEQYGVATQTELLYGKPYYSIYEKIKTVDADLLVVGRSGMHVGKFGSLGSNAERIAELVPTNVLVVGMITKNMTESTHNSSLQNNEINKTHGEKVIWDEEAKHRLENIPSFARPMAVLAIERYAKEKGITVITPMVMQEARHRYE